MYMMLSFIVHEVNRNIKYIDFYLHTHIITHRNITKWNYWRYKVFYFSSNAIHLCQSMKITDRYERVKRTKFLLAVIYRSPRRHSNSSEAFKTMNRPGPTVKLSDWLFLRKYKRRGCGIFTLSSFTRYFDEDSSSYPRQNTCWNVSIYWDLHMMHNVC